MRQAFAPREGERASAVSVNCGLAEKVIAEMGQAAELRVEFAPGELGSRCSEQGGAGSQLQRICRPSHKIINGDPARQLLRDSNDNFLAPAPQHRVAQIGSGFIEITECELLRGRGPSEAGNLRKHIPNPVAKLAAFADLSKRRRIILQFSHLCLMESFQ